MDINQLLFLGTNKYGQAGIGEKHHNKTFTVPKSFAFPIFIKQISCGAHHSALLTIDGNVYTMGSNIHGALGSNPTLNYSFAPTLVEGLGEVSKIECGPFHMCAISEGFLYSWGKGIDGQLGHGNTKNMSKPTKVEALGEGVESVSCGTNHTLTMLKKDGKNVCYAFGNGIYGQLGTGQSRNSYIPSKVKLEQVEGIAAGDNHSLFIVKGNVYACGDNSNGQLGALFSKKFNPQPTKVEFEGSNENIINVQAKKYSLAITDAGEMYVWGVKNGFGVPKQIKSSQSKVEVIDSRLGSDKCYGLSTQGSLYCWDVLKGKQFQNQWLCQEDVVVSNSRAILDFSVGEGYVLILGDIVKQVQYSSVPPTTLSCFEDIDFSQENTRKFEESEFRESQIHSIDSNVQASSRESHFECIKPQSLTPVRTDRSDQSNQHQLPNMFLKQKSVNQNHDLSRTSCLNQRKDFNNLINLGMLDKKQENIRVFTSNPVPQPQKICQRERENIQNDTFEVGQSQSSSIQCQPTNFLRESMRREEQEHKKIVVASIFQSEERIPALQQIRRPLKPAMSKENKENLQPKKTQKKEKHKKIDKIMELLQKSHHISAKSLGESALEGQGNPLEETTKQMQIIKTNRILRVQLREKELKISQMQQLLSRKQMQIEAQRQVIKLLRQKNASNFASLQHP